MTPGPELPMGDQLDEHLDDQDKQSGDQLKQQPLTPAGEAEPVTPPDPVPPPAAQAGAPAKAGKSALREWVETIVGALILALIIRTFIVQVYQVEGPSMEPTLYTGERLLVNKLVYRFRNPAPGEIVVLKDPQRPNRELIKRVIAVEGEVVEVRKGVVYINGQPLREPYINTVGNRQDDMKPLTVPKGYIFVMGDNRGWSYDSRNMGPVPVQKVDGKAFFLFWPLSQFNHGPLDQPRTTAAAQQ
jgi:signal peptidase I